MVNTKHKRAAEIQDSIRQILLQDWDPLQVRDIPQCEHEYDSYVGGVYRILASSRSEQQLADYLLKTGHEIMGAPLAAGASSEGLRPLARKLLEVDVRL
jgi:hypothetical protein